MLQIKTAWKYVWIFLYVILGVGISIQLFQGADLLTSGKLYIFGCIAYTTYRLVLLKLKPSIINLETIPENPKRWSPTVHIEDWELDDDDD